MVQDFHITGAAGTTIVPQVSFTDYFKVHFWLFTLRNWLFEKLAVSSIAVVLTIVYFS